MTAQDPLPRVLVISEDDDLSGPLEDLLTHAGYEVDVADGREGARLLAGGAGGGGFGAPVSAGGLPDALILDRDLRPDDYQMAIDALASRAGRASFPLLVLGGGPAPGVPAGWHEDAFASLSRPPQPGEIAATLTFLRRLAVYRRYRDLLHDLAQPVMTLHALGRSIAKLEVEDDAARRTIERFVRETEHLMSLMEDFQRSRGGS